MTSNKQKDILLVAGGYYLRDDAIASYAHYEISLVQILLHIINQQI